ncbi:sodium- and chloride-dependent glycine transporter 2-like [Tubulanus polymorphus]|uniref:sodium- and chloride-dependent glycine transporter 2-like n=1 Tax=Tubulanus polymorphus TaxID=672921 RepID=UPI003DA66EDB
MKTESENDEDNKLKIVEEESEVMIQESEPKRAEWGKEIDFFLSCIGYAVGLGNVWRFPYLCMRNGGGAFLIPYFTFMVLAGMPLYFLEMAIGQYSGKSPITVFDICPMFTGLGYGMVIESLMYTVYTSIIIAWIMYYLGMSFTSWVPVWGRCDNAWNTENCIVPGGDRMNPNSTTSTNHSSTTNQSIVTTAASSFRIIHHGNDSFLPSNTSNTSVLGKPMSSGEEFWQYNVLELTDDIGNLGGFRWELVVCLFVSWIVVFLCLFKGVRSSGKVVYVTATAPFLFLIALFVRGVTLPGSYDGIMFYITPDWSKLLSFRIWSEACLQIFYSLGASWGGLVTMASYNKFNHNIYRDAIVIPLVTCGTSFFAGFVIFSVIGFLAHEANLPVEEAVTSGPGLAFIAYPMALAKIPGAPIWSAMFFLMLFTIGLDTVFVSFETFISAFVDKFPAIRKRKMLFVIGSSITCFLMGLIFCSRGGMYWFQLIDWFMSIFTVLVIGIFECIIISYIYGVNRFYNEIEMMIGYRPSVVWKGCWGFAIPASLTIFLTYLLAVQVWPYYGSYRYPTWAIGIGWLIAFVSAIPIPYCMITRLYTTPGTLKQRLFRASRPAATWGPNIHKTDNQDEQMIPETIVLTKSSDEPDLIV